MSRGGGGRRQAVPHVALVERNQRLDMLRWLLWIETTLAISAFFVWLVVASDDERARLLSSLFWAEFLVFTPLMWLFVLLVERSGGTASIVLLIVLSSLLEIALIVQLAYAISFWSRRIVPPFVIILLDLLANSTLVVASGLYCGSQRGASKQERTRQVESGSVK